jgi:hypothetical protein
MVVTVSAPLIDAVEETDTELVVVPPGPEMLTESGLGENVRLCAAAVSGLPNRAHVAKMRTTAKRLNLSKIFSPDGTASTACFAKVCNLRAILYQSEHEPASRRFNSCSSRLSARM